MLRTKQMRHKALKETPPIDVPESAVPHWERAGWGLVDDSAPSPGSPREPEPPRDPGPPPQPEPQPQTPPAPPAVSVNTPARRQPTTERSAD